MGLSAKDIAARSSVGLLKRNGISGEPDPIDEGLAVRRKMLGTRIIDGEVTREELESQKAKNELLQAQIEEKRLRSEEKGGDSAWQKYILDQLEATRQEAANATALLHQQTVDILNSRYDMLSQEVERLKAQPAPVQESTREVVIRAFQEMDELQALRKPDLSAPPVGNDQAMTAYLKRMELDHELRKENLKFEQEERKEKREQDKRLQEQELAIKTAHFERQDKFLEDGLPRLLGLGESLLARFTGGAAPQASPQTAANFPAGVKVSNCPQCSTRMAYRENQGSVICSGCGSEFGITPDAPQQSSPQGEEA